VEEVRGVERRVHGMVDGKSRVFWSGEVESDIWVKDKLAVRCDGYGKLTFGYWSGHLWEDWNSLTPSLSFVRKEMAIQIELLESLPDYGLLPNRHLHKVPHVPLSPKTFTT